MKDEIIEKLTEMLEAAKSSRLTHLAYHYDNGTENCWGFIAVNDHGQLLIPARLAALAVEKRDEKPEAAQ